MSLRDIVNPLNIVLVLLFALATIGGFVLVPAGTLLPIHWGITGEPDAFMVRDMALLLLPAISVGLFGLLMGFSRLASPEQREAARHAFAAVVSVLLALFVTIQSATVLIGAGYEVDMVRIVVVGIGMVFVVLGNVMPKTRPNALAGIRLPWTLRDPANWQATNRFGGLLMMLGGAATVVAAVVTGHPVVLLVAAALGIFLPIAITLIYSYRLSHR